MEEVKKEIPCKDIGIGNNDDRQRVLCENLISTDGIGLALLSPPEKTGMYKQLNLQYWILLPGIPVWNFK